MTRFCHSMSGLTPPSVPMISNVAWLKKVDDDVRKFEREKAERAGHGNGSDHE